MESIVRTLRTGKEDGGITPYAILIDNVDAIGGNIFIQRVLEGLVKGIPSDHAVVLVALSQPPSAYSHLFKPPKFTPLSIIDCFTDPYAWKPPSKSTTSTSFPLFTQHHSTEQALHLLLQKITSIHPENTKISLIIDCISPLVHHFGSHSIALFIQTLRHHPSIASLCTLIHEDHQQQNELSLCIYNASCTITLQPAHGLILENKIKQQQQTPSTRIVGAGRTGEAHGKLTIRTKKRSGCIKTENFEYWVMSNKSIECVSIGNNTLAQHPTNVVKKTTEQSKSTQKDHKPTPSTSSITQQFAGGMKLELSEEEIAARSRVQLPYEHQGQSSLYSTTDYREYLPTEAGGTMQGVGRLGHILYVRDSDSDPDSDEDPDDDLDI